MKTIDIIIPCKNEETNINLVYNEIMKFDKDLNQVIDTDLNFIFIDDGSNDNTSNVIKDLSSKVGNVKYIIFSKNFGKEPAIYAGLSKSDADYVVIMDSDMQDPPSLIIDMYKAIINENYYACGTRRTNRKGEPIIRSIFSKLFYFIINKLSNINIPDGMRDFCLMNKNFKNSILMFKEKNRFFKGMFCNVGYKIKWFEYDNILRSSGMSSWSFISLVKYALSAIMSFSNVPLLISSIFGIVFCFISIIAMLFIVIRALMFGDRVVGWPSLVSIILFLSGLQFLFIGMIGLYVSKNYFEIKNRPLYLIMEEK